MKRKRQSTLGEYFATRKRLHHDAIIPEGPDTPPLFLIPNEVLVLMLEYLPIMDLLRFRVAIVMNRCGSSVARDAGLTKESLMRCYADASGLRYKDMDVRMTPRIMDDIARRMRCRCQRCGTSKGPRRACPFYNDRKLCKDCSIVSFEEDMIRGGMMCLHRYCKMEGHDGYRMAEMMGDGSVSRFKVWGQKMYAISIKDAGVLYF